MKAQKVPLDMYIMLDQSGSMSDSVSGGTKWTTVTSALDTFVQQPGLDGVSVGLGYFGVPPGGNNTCTVLACNTDADCGASACGPCFPPTGGGICTGFISSGDDSCAAADYATAAVEIAPLPGAAGTITSSIGAHSPSTGTPTSAALQGAIDHASAWASAHAGDVVVVVLATDGLPEECDTNVTNIDAIAAAGFNGTPKIPTYVIGVGSETTTLNSIAVSGGTSSAFLVDTGGNVNQQFLDAMNTIRGTQLACAYQIPQPVDGSAPDYNSVNVVYHPGNGGAPVTFPRVNSKADCPASGDGWYYDDPNMPKQILLCDGTCTEISADLSGEVDVTLGCSTVIF